MYVCVCVIPYCAMLCPSVVCVYVCDDSPFWGIVGLGTREIMEHWLALLTGRFHQQQQK